jgi:hypothetical protein
VAAIFEHAQVPGNIGIDVSVWVVDGIAHVGLRGEVDDGAEVFHAYSLHERILSAQLNPKKLEIRKGGELHQATALQLVIRPL